MADGYNGWTNYETWAWKLWMDNDEGSCRAGDGLAREAYRDAVADKSNTRLERAALDLSDMLKEQAAENLPEVEGVWADLLSAAVGEINWYEIAKAMVEDVADDVNEEEAEAESEEEADDETAD